MSAFKAERYPARPLIPFKPFIPEGVRTVERRDMFTADINSDPH